jgi:outer membrane protein assembly factor BamB
LRRLLIIAIVAAVLLSSAAFAADWPQFRGPSSNGISAEKGIAKTWNQAAPKMLWKTPLTDNGYAGPSVAGGKVFIIDHKGGQDIVRALDVKTGKEVWKYNYPDAEGDNYGFSRATPTVSGGRVYTIGRMGVVSCLDAKTGAKIWSRDTLADFKGNKPQWNYAMSPVIDGNKVIVCPGGPDASVVALDKTTGKTIWQGGGSDLPGYSTPVIATIDGKKQYVVLTGVSLIGVDAATGTLLWRQGWKTMYDINGAQPIVIGNTVFITSGYGHGCGLIEVQGGNAKIKWENKELVGRFSSPVLLGGFIYGVGEPGALVCLDPSTGIAKWKYGGKDDGFEFGGLVAIDGVLLVADGKSGKLTMVTQSPDSYQELGKFTPLGGQSWTAPIVANGNLIMRNKSDVACFALK